MGAARNSCAVKVPRSVPDQSGKRSLAIVSTPETVQHRLGAIGGYLEHGTRVVRAPGCGRAEHVSGCIQKQIASRSSSVRAPGKSVEHREVARWFQLEYGPVLMRAFIRGCAVEIAGVVAYQAGEWVHTVVAHKVENQFLGEMLGLG